MTSLKAWAAGYGAALVVLGVLDGLWLGLLARNFYQREFGDLMASSVRVAPAVVFYLAYPLLLLALALSPEPVAGWTWGDVLWRSALLGLVAYGTYELTNLATLRDWSLRLVLVDLGWGVFITTAAGAGAFWAMRRFM